MSTQYAVIVFIASFSMIVMMVAVWDNSFLAVRRRRSFLLLFALLMLANVAEWLGVRLDGASADLRTLHIFAKFVELMIAPVIPIVCASAIGEDGDARFILIPICVNVALQVVSLFTGIVFSVDSGNVYHRGMLYLLYVATFVCGGAFLFVRCYRFSRRYQDHNALFLTLIIVLMLFAVSFPFIDSDLRLDWTTASIAAILFYIYYDGLIQQVDDLTTLLNRRMYDYRIEDLSRRAAILFFDVDLFKNVNDTYGHQFGDECLFRLAAEVKDVFGREGYCYRFGGDEFCAILTHGIDEVEGNISEFIHHLEQLRADDPRLPRVSVGYAIFDPDIETVSAALNRADEMMYLYKRKRHAAASGAEQI